MVRVVAHMPRVINENDVVLQYIPETGAISKRYRLVCWRVITTLLFLINLNVLVGSIAFLRGVTINTKSSGEHLHEEVHAGKKPTPKHTLSFLLDEDSGMCVLNM